MNPITFIFMMLGTLMSAIVMGGFYLALTDWVTDLNQGIYRTNHLECLLETSLLMVYIALGIRLCRRVIAG